MRIYFLREPRISKKKPVKGCEPIGPFSGIGVPGVSCSICGETWATSLNFIAKDLSAGHFLWNRGQQPGSLEEIADIATNVRSTLNLPDDIPLMPGTRVSILRLACLRDDLDFEWPIINTLLITDQVKIFLEEHKLLGWQAEPTIITQARADRNTLVLYELRIIGRGGRAIAEPSPQITLCCSGCGRIEYNQGYADIIPETFGLDTSQWDGSDIFRFAPPFHGRICVTEQFKLILEQSRFENYELVPVEEELQRLKRRW